MQFLGNDVLHLASVQANILHLVALMIHALLRSNKRTILR